MTTVSAEDGSFSFENIPFGTWYIREIEQPTGFVLNDTVYPVTVGQNGQVVEVEIVNRHIRGNITLTKVDADYPENKLTGATFEVYKDNNGDGKLDDGDTLGTDTFGNITRFDNALEGLPKRLEINEQELENTKKQFETAKVDVGKPFNQEEELTAKTARLNELNALLNVDKRENEIVGGEPDEGDDTPTPKNKDRER